MLSLTYIHITAVVVNSVGTPESNQAKPSAIIPVVHIALVVGII